MKLLLGLIFIVASACSSGRDVALNRADYVHNNIRVEAKYNDLSEGGRGGEVSLDIFSSSVSSGVKSSVNYTLVDFGEKENISWLIGSPEELAQLVDGGVFRFSSTKRRDGMRLSLHGGYLINDTYTRQCRYLHQVGDRIIPAGLRCQVIIPDQGLLYLTVIPGEFSGYEGDIINKIDIIVKNVSEKSGVL